MTRTAQELMEWYDLRVLSDAHSAQPSYAIGRDDGEHEFCATPFFPSAQEAMQYLEEHQDGVLAGDWNEE